MLPKKARGLCFYCQKSQVFTLKPMGNVARGGGEYYLCPNCNASNSTIRIRAEIKKGIAKEIE